MAELHDYFKVHFIVLKCIGIPLEPMKHTAIVWKILYCMFSVFFVGLFPVYFALSEFLQLFNESNIDTFTFNLSYAITHCLGTTKILLFTAKRRNIYNLCKAFEEGDLRPNFNRGGQEEFNIVQKAIKRVNGQAFIFNVIVIFVLSNRLIALLTGNLEKGTEIKFDAFSNTSSKLIRPTPFYGYFPFDYQYSPLYELICVYQIGVAWLYGLYLGCTDTILTGFMIHIKAQLLILKNCINTFVERAVRKQWEEKGILPLHRKKQIQDEICNVEELTEDVRKHAYAIITGCVKHHQRIIELSKRVEKEFNVLMLLQVLSGVAMTCFQLFQLSMSDPKSFRFASMMFYIILMSFQLVTYCWNGNEAMRHSVDVANKVFQCDWINADESTKKMLLLMMLRSQRPIQFTAAKFTALSLETYMKILKASASYFMFLRQINH